jgi:hypothetical protein
MIPAGSSRKILEKNHAETTRPTNTPEGSSSSAKMDRKLEDRLMPVMMLNPMKRSL